MAYAERDDPIPGAIRWRSDSGGGLVLPDGCMDLILLGDRVVVAGPDTRAHRTDADLGPAVGLRLPPGYLPLVLPVPADEVPDRCVPLADLAGARVAQILGRDAHHRGADALSAFVGARLGLEQERALARTRHTVARIVAGHAVADIARDLAHSERQFRRNCLRQFGYGPATLRRILRVDRALAHHRLGMPLAAAATAAGFSDQAHFTRVCADLTGRPPGALVRSSWSGRATRLIGE